MTTNNPGPLYPDNSCKFIPHTCHLGEECRACAMLDAERNASPHRRAPLLETENSKLRSRIRDLEAQLNSQTFVLNPGPQWKPLLVDNMLQIDEGTTYLFAIEVDGGWEYFSDSIGWDADEETVPTWRDGNHGWSIESVTHYADMPAPPVQAKGDE